MRCAGDGDEVLAPSSEGVDTDGIKGADVATPPGAATVVDPNGAGCSAACTTHLYSTLAGCCPTAVQQHCTFCFATAPLAAAGVHAPGAC